MLFFQNLFVIMRSRDACNTDQNDQSTSGRTFDSLANLEWLHAIRKKLMSLVQNVVSRKIADDEREVEEGSKGDVDTLEPAGGAGSVRVVALESWRQQSGFRGLPTSDYFAS